MEIVTYPHPTLRHKSKPVRRVDAELKQMVRQMFELMYEHDGVGLAANQVDLPLRLFVTNPTAKPDEGQEMVFINPVISKPSGAEEKDEGCLSIPELYGAVRRPEKIQVTAYDLQGQMIEAELSGLPSRIVQHETDHLDGILFIDRLSETGAMQARDALEDFEIAFESRRTTGEIPADEEIAARLAELEKKYC